MRNVTELALVLSLLTGAAAAAKEPPRPEPKRQSAGCEWAGPGFIKAEGSGTCIKVDGSVRADYSTRGTGPAYLPHSQGQ